MTERWRAEAKKVALEVYEALLFDDEQGAIDAILRLIERVQPQWQPIETAPKDGTAVLGYFPSLRGYVARQDVVPIVWVEWGGGIWQNATSGHNMLGDEPMHWMAIPDPLGAGAASPSGERGACPCGFSDEPWHWPRGGICAVGMQTKVGNNQPED